eukprot:3531692-Ditylum_brightwellii.AAC.1
MSLKPSMFYISDPVIIIVSVNAILHHPELFPYKSPPVEVQRISSGHICSTGMIYHLWSSKYFETGID